MSRPFDELLASCGTRIIPVITIDSLASAVPLARALVDGGLRVLEVTLRTPAGLGAIELIAAEVDGVIVGAGSVISPEQMSAATAAGARFIVSPGATDRLLAAADDTDTTFLPGAATATEALRLLDQGITVAKFFPAETSGGPAALAALAGPLPQLRFCPTGGIGPDNVARYLALPNVVCVGGSWMLPADARARGDWAAITAAAAQASAL